MPHTRFQYHSSSGSVEEDFIVFYAKYAHGGHLGHVTTIYI